MVTPILKYASLENRPGQQVAPTRRAWLARSRVALACGVALIALACGDAATPAPADQAAAAKRAAPTEPRRAPTPLLAGNLLRNPGFEAGAQGWGIREERDSVGFEVVSEPVHSGQRAAHLVASWQSGNPERPVSVRSATQEISPPRFPDRVAGWYRVDRWEYVPNQAELQLQIIVAAIGDPRIREIVKPEDIDRPEVYAKLDNFQLRYQLAGPTDEPEDGGNIRNRVVGKGPPDLGSWVRFDLPVKSDFGQRWGSVPANYRQLRIMFAVRWDDKEEGAALHADVYYDDLFFGFEDP